VRTGSFSGAARELAVTQSAVTGLKTPADLRGALLLHCEPSSAWAHWLDAASLALGNMKIGAFRDWLMNVSAVNP